MSTELSETASEYHERKQRLEAKREELADTRSELFGTDSEEIEERARSLFSEAGDAGGDGNLDEIESVREEIESIESDLADLRAELEGELAEMRLPFAETIDAREEATEVAFPFAEPIPEEALAGIRDVVRPHLEGEPIELRSEEVAVETDDIGEAISETEAFVTGVRESAREGVDGDEPARGNSGSGSIFG